MKKAAKSALADKLHKGFVLSCVAVTVYGCYLLGWRFQRYFTVIRPMHQQQELQTKQELLAEGRDPDQSPESLKC